CQWVFHDCTLRNLQLQCIRRNAEIAQKYSYVFNQLWLHELLDREVPAYNQIAIGAHLAPPLPQAPAGLPQTPPAQVTNQAGFFRDWNKYIWADQTTRRVMPAH